MAGRDLSLEAEAAVQAPHDDRCHLVSIQTPAGVLLMTNHVRNINWLGVDYLAVGALGTIGSVTETFEVRPEGLELSLSWPDPSIKAVAESDFYPMSQVTVYIQFLDQNGDRNGDPVLYWEGFLDSMEIVTSAEGCVILAKCEHWFVEWDQPRRMTYTDEDQRAIHPHDGLFKYADQTDVEVAWGKSRIRGLSIADQIRNQFLEEQRDGRGGNSIP